MTRPSSECLSLKPSISSTVSTTSYISENPALSSHQFFFAVSGFSVSHTHTQTPILSHVHTRICSHALCEHPCEHPTYKHDIYMSTTQIYTKKYTKACTCPDTDGCLMLSTLNILMRPSGVLTFDNCVRERDIGPVTTFTMLHRSWICKCDRSPVGSGTRLVCVR